MGAPAIVVLGLAGIALFGSMVLTYAFLAYGQPAGTALALVLAVIFAFWNDNHWVRTVDDAGLAARKGARNPARPRASVIAVGAPPTRISMPSTGVSPLFW
jgi:hypothetical protein